MSTITLPRIRSATIAGRPRGRRLVAALTVAAAVLLAALVVPAGRAHAASQQGSWNGSFVAAVNARRSAHGLSPLSASGDLTAVAQAHAVEMANAQRIWHNPNLTSQVPNWLSVGENVGNGNSVSWLMNAFMNSPSHRANILGSSFTQIGVGTAASSSGMIYVVQVFRKPEGAGTPAPAAPSRSTHITVHVRHTPRPASTSRATPDHASARPISTPGHPQAGHPSHAPDAAQSNHGGHAAAPTKSAIRTAPRTSPGSTHAGVTPPRTASGLLAGTLAGMTSSANHTGADPLSAALSWSSALQRHRDR